MKFPALVVLASVAVVHLGCGGGDAGDEPMAETTPPTETAPPAEAMPEPAAQEQVESLQREPAPPPRTVAMPMMPATDEPYEPVYSGTVAPGMSRADVVMVWGEPATERTTGTRQYLYYRNGCEASCGTFDVVFLENGAVVDAIVRGPGHEYAGASSSPPGQDGVFTPPIP